MILGLLFFALLPFALVGIGSDLLGSADGAEEPDEEDQGALRETDTVGDVGDFLAASTGTAPNGLDLEKVGDNSIHSLNAAGKAETQKSGVEFEDALVDRDAGMGSFETPPMDRGIEIFDFNGIDANEHLLSDHSDNFETQRTENEIGSEGVIIDVNGTPVLDSEGQVDLIYGNGGNDQIVAGNGPAMIDGGLGDDAITSRSGASVLFGRAGDDYIESSGEHQSFQVGGAGNDVLVGGDESDWLYGDSFVRTQNEPAGRDELHGGGGNDILIGGKGTDELAGGDGDDLIILEGDDTANGGAGRDEFRVVGEFTPDEGFSIVDDFLRGIDELVIEVDEEDSESISVSVTNSQEGSVVSVNGSPVVALRGCTDFTLDDVRLRSVDIQGLNRAGFTGG